MRAHKINGPNVQMRMAPIKGANHLFNTTISLTETILIYG